jgi:hypothetical protein
MNRQEIEAACDSVRASGNFEGRSYSPDVVPLDPNTNAVIERLFDPFQLARQIESHGFRVRVVGYWGGARGMPVVRLANRVLQAFTPLTIRTAPAFWVSGTLVSH